MDPADISGQITQAFYAQIDSKKWSDRKEALEIVEKATSAPRIANCDFNELVRILKKVVAKDSNIVVATLAAKCLHQLALGLGTNFAPYSNSTLATIFDKFKEKKPNVISVLRDAADSAFVGTNLEGIYEDVIQFLDNKNPQIKSEMCQFLTRAFARYPTQVLNKKTLRPVINALIKTLSDMDSTVRDSAAQAIGTAMKVAGEKLTMTLIADVEAIKVAKIREFCEKAEIYEPPTNGQAEIVHIDSTAQPSNQQAPTNGVTDEVEEDSDEQMYDMMEAVDITNQITVAFYTQMESKKWSDRKEALEVIEKATAVSKITNCDLSELVRVLKRTVAKDSNIVVATSAAKCLHQLAKGLRTNFSPYSTSTLTIIFDKFKEKKPNVVSVLRDAADSAFIGTNLEGIYEDVIPFLDNKNPQIKSEVCLFLSRVFAKYPAQVLNKKTLRPLINALIKTLSDMDSTVRDSAAQAIGTAMKVVGEKLMMPLIADVEAIKITKIKEFCEKAEVKKVPKSAVIAMNNQTAQNTQPAQVPAKNSATMVRSTSNRRLTTSIKAPPPKPAVPVPSAATTTQSATVKRNATIIKRTAVPKRTANHAASNQPAQVPAPAPLAQVQVTAQPTATNNLMGPPTMTMSTPAKPVYAASQLAPNKLTKHDIHDSTLLCLISDKSHEVLNALVEIETALVDGSEYTFKSRINQIIDLASLQLVKTFDSLKNKTSEEDLQSQRMRKICDLLSKIFNRRPLVAAIRQQTARFLLLQLFAMTQTCDSIKDRENEASIQKDLSNLASAIMDGYEPATIMCVLTSMLNVPTHVSIVTPVKDAIIRSMRSLG